MFTDIKDYVVQFDNCIPENICKETISYINNINFQTHYFYEPSTKSYKKESGDNEFSVSWDNISNKEVLNDYFENAILDYQNKFNFTWFKGYNAFSTIRFNKYDQNTKMAKHIDHIHTLFDGDQKGIPILTILGVLNDGYEGGEFILVDKHEIKFKTGDILVFPSTFVYPHKVEQIKKGVRYSMISWMW